MLAEGLAFDAGASADRRGGFVVSKRSFDGDARDG